ncbi:MAG TPA: DUF1499 domain-containing protein [Deltaproteobacteria bacterium]|nr:DUF1499 domain-containing protein [Deltaproteobacteria bacterium]HPR56622.1 DUF1499 domain-containing protein [Deltaproteobacteria bacterium]HXK47926.1 DUF1499 domain-containing protein [Deltaproteobacteria bacterium]
MLKIGGTLMLCMLLMGCSGPRPSTLGLKDGRLFPCPDSPNCVSTQERSEGHRIEPLRYTGTKENARQKLLQVIGGMPRVKIVTDSGDYIHAEFASRIFRFVDDVEFVFDDAEKLIHFRSASRLGYSDLGVNRRRMEEIRRRFEAQ